MRRKASNALPAPLPIRALEQFDTRLAPTFKTFLVTDDGSEPHLKRGEYAVIDTTDRTPQHGELYLIQYKSGQRSRRLVCVTRDFINITGPGAPDSEVWWCGDLRGWRQVSGFRDVKVFGGMSDGPYLADNLEAKLVGRVVGFAESSLGAALAPTAGWENEEEGNAAFDASEYLDALIAAGFVPFVFNDGYGEMFPERALSDEQEAAVMAVRAKFCAASLALDCVIAECLKRGLRGRRAAR